MDVAWSDREKEFLNIVKKHTKITLQLWSANSIKDLLRNQKITNYEKTPKSGMPKLPKDYLKTHENKYLRMVAEARELDKAKNAFPLIEENITNMTSNFSEKIINVGNEINEISKTFSESITNNSKKINKDISLFRTKEILELKNMEVYSTYSEIPPH